MLAKSLKDWTAFVKNKGGGHCQECGSTENLHMHHIVPQWKDQSLRLETDNGICLCRRCHWDKHKEDPWPTGDRPPKMKMVTVRLPEEIIDSILLLSSQFGMSQGRVIERAIDRLYREEKP